MTGLDEVVDKAVDHAFDWDYVLDEHTAPDAVGHFCAELGIDLSPAQRRRAALEAIGRYENLLP